MNTKLVNTTAGVINAALTRNVTAAGIAIALESAGLLMTPEIAAELAELRDRVAELEAAAASPHTPRLCICGHSPHAHTVPAPHSCFAFGQTCPCPTYRQLPHDEAEEQFKRNLRAAEERQREQERAIGSADKLTGLFAPVQSLREDPHDGPLHHDYRVGRDLPELGGA